MDASTFEQIKNNTTMTVDQKNVAIVRAKRVELVTSRIPAAVRKALSAAVKAGELGHIKKDGHKPEAFFHPTFQYLVAGMRNAHEDKIKQATGAIMTYREYRAVPNV